MAHMTIDIPDLPVLDRTAAPSGTATSEAASVATEPARDAVTDAASDRHHERLRSVVPAAVAVGLLLAVVVAGGLVLRDMVDFGLWFAGQF